MRYLVRREANEPLIIFKIVYEWDDREIDVVPTPAIRLPPGAENA